MGVPTATPALFRTDADRTGDSATPTETATKETAGSRMLTLIAIFVLLALLPVILVLIFLASCVMLVVGLIAWILIALFGLLFDMEIIHD